MFATNPGLFTPSKDLKAGCSREKSKRRTVM